MRFRTSPTRLLTISLGLLACLCSMAAVVPENAPGELGPDRVILKELQSLYEPVPFDHRGHARMSQMWEGCTTCHHRTPEPTTRPAATLSDAQKTQDASAKVPACKSCHALGGDDANIRMPHLKGAYHRQCLNCHREWMQANNCVICHKPRGGQEAAAHEPTPDDIVARMHPPMPEPDVKAYRARFTPADGKNVLFRHKEHTKQYGLKCVYCHYRENCSGCHQGGGTNRSGPKPMKPGKTWTESHTPCAGCHKQDRCKSCHYKDGQAPPPAFEHRRTGQLLDKDHESLGCLQCHNDPTSREKLTCGDAQCHSRSSPVFPAKRPGPLATARPASDSMQTVHSHVTFERGTP